MPRALRIEYEDAIYHVMARGNQRRNIVFEDVDRQLFVDTLTEGKGSGALLTIPSPLPAAYPSGKAWKRGQANPGNGSGYKLRYRKGIRETGQVRS